MKKHPRVCGEDFLLRSKDSGWKETPPRMRGRPVGFVQQADEVGNTPAYAGKTATRPTPTQKLRKHPRVCGEDPTLLGAKNLDAETPPRMRGRLSKSGVIPLKKRNTPAYAGKTA